MDDPTLPQTPTPRPGDCDGPDDADPSREYWCLWRQGRQPEVEVFLIQAGISDPERIARVLRVDQAERCRLGEWVPAESYLAAFPAVAAVAECAIDVVFAEYLLREGRGERLRLEEFQARFPQYSDELKLQIDLHRAMQAAPAPEGPRAVGPATLVIEPGSGPGAGTASFPEIPGYEVLGELGRGGMGVVYRAWQAELKRTVAVKMVHAGAQASPDVLARFRVEAEAVARLRHPNIVQIHDVGQHAGAPFLVLELVEGHSLAQRIAGTPQPAGWAAEAMETVARAIHAAHRQGVIHRDLSPANILLGADGMPKIADFGLAKLLGGDGSLRTRTGDLLGTPSYMAPEQAGSRHREIGAATDVYALGAILYEMLTGRPPFKAEGPMETLRQVIDDEPVTPSRLRPRLPRDLETICLKCLQKEPARRYADAEALADDLRRFREGRSILARRSTAAERFWRWCRRNPGLATANIAAATLTMALAIGATLAAWAYRDQLITIRHTEAQERRARNEAREQLFASLLDRARAGRFSRRVGQRFDSLDALRRAAEIGRELGLPPDRFEALRDEAIACLALPDLRSTGRAIPVAEGAVHTVFDPTMTLYAHRFPDRVEVRRVTDDQEVARFAARGDREIFNFGFSPDGRYLLSTHYPGFALTLWDVERRAAVIDDPGRIARARFFPGGTRIALGRQDGEIRVHDLGTGRMIHRWRGPGLLQDLAIGPDGARFATLHNQGDGSSCRIVEAESGRLIRSIPLPSTGESVAWSPDGASLVTTGRDLRIYLWDAATGGRKATLEGSTNGGLFAFFHPAGTLLAGCGWDSRLRFWDTALGRPIFSLSAWPCSEFGRDGRMAIGAEARVAPHEVDPALEYRTLGRSTAMSTQYHRPSVRRDGRLLAVGTSQGAVLWDLAQAREIALLPIGIAWHLTFEPSGDLLTSGSAGVWRWPVRLDPGRGEFRIGPPRRLALPAGLGFIDQDRSGRVVAKANFDSVSVLTPGRKLVVEPLDDCRTVAVSPDGEWLATGSHQRGAQVRRLDDPARVIDLPTSNRTQGFFSPDARWLMTNSSSRLWTVGTWGEARQLGGLGLGFSPDGRLAVVIDANQVIRLVEPGSGRTVARIESPDAHRVHWATFSPDGSRLVVTTPDGPAVHVWDLRAIRRHLRGLGLDWGAPAYPDDDSAGPAAAPLPPPRVDLGPMAREAERFREAPEDLVRRYTARLASHPEDAEARHHRGHALAAMGRHDEAIDDFTAAIRLRPDDGHLRGARGLIHRSLRRDDLAIADLADALERLADDAVGAESLALDGNDLAWEMARIPRPVHHLDRAAVLCRRALTIAPDSASMLLNTLGVVQYRACRHAEAVATLKRSLAAGRGRTDGLDLFVLAMAHHRLGHRDAARDYLDRALRWQAGATWLLGSTNDLAAFRAEAEAVLAGPAGELPDDVFAPLQRGGD